MKTRILFVIAAAVILAGAVCANAQPDSTRKGRFQKVVKEKFMEKVGVDEKTTDKFMEAMKKHKDEMKQLQQKRMTLHREIMDNPSDPNIQSKLDEFIDIDYKMHLSRKNFFSEVKTFMTAEQMAKTMAFQKDMKDFMKKNKKGKNKNKRGNDFDPPPDGEGPPPDGRPGDGFMD